MLQCEHEPQEYVWPNSENNVTSLPLTKNIVRCFNGCLQSKQMQRSTETVQQQNRHIHTHKHTHTQTNIHTHKHTHTLIVLNIIRGLQTNA